jgi:alpha-mannosidase
MSKKTPIARRNFISQSLLAALSLSVSGRIHATVTKTPFIRGRGPLVPEDTFYVIPHNHWEGAVFATREAYLEMGLPHIITALKLLKEFPEYRFVLDQVNYVKPFIDRYEEEGPAFRRFIKEGRLQIVGGTNTMHDTNSPSGESIVRQMLYGKGYFRKTLGVDVTTGWSLDTFGHNAQMPQIFRLAGYRSMWFMRGVPNRTLPTEFFWKGIDGTTIDAFWLSQTYVNLARVPAETAAFNTFIKKKFDDLTPNIEGEKNRVGFAGWDVENPQEHLPVKVKEFDSASDKPFNLKFITPIEYEAIASKRNNRQTISGEFNPIFQGVYSSRIELKQKLRQVEEILTTAEQLGAINEMLGYPTRDAEIWKAWEPVLFNQAHDLMSGVMTDHVYAETIRGYEYAEQVGKELIDERLENLLSQIDTSGDGIPVVVFNTLGSTRTDITEADIGFIDDGNFDIELKDGSGKIIPVEILKGEKFDDGSIRQARIIFVAEDIPAMGYKVFRVTGKQTPPAHDAEKDNATEKNQIENDLYRITFNPFTGAITSLFDKGNNWEVLKAPGNVVVRQYDGGDFWELYQHLRDGMIQKTTRQPVPTDFKERLSSEGQYRGEKGVFHHGKVYSEFNVSHGFGGSNNFSTRVRIYNGLKRIDVQTKVYNTEKFVRYQVMFPTAIQKGTMTHEIPFGVLERPQGVEYPAQNWADFSDGTKGFTVINRGLPGNLTTDSTMLVSLMRSAKIDNYPYIGGYEKWMTSDTGLEINKTLTFDYAIMPHAGNWREAGVFSEARAFNFPLLSRKESLHAGKLKKTWNLFDISDSSVVVTAMKPGNNGTTIIRVYEAGGQNRNNVRITFNQSVQSVQEVNLMEDPIAALKISSNILPFNIRAFEIKTFAVKWKK